MIRQLAKLARLTKEELAMAWLTVGEGVRGSPGEGIGQDRDSEPGRKGRLPLSPPVSDGLWRVTSEAMLNKAGRTRFMVCGAAGRTSLSLKQGELLAASAEGKAKNRAQALENLFFGLRRGDAIRLRGAIERDSAWGVGPDTRIEIV